MSTLQPNAEKKRSDVLSVPDRGHYFGHGEEEVLERRNKLKAERLQEYKNVTKSVCSENRYV